MAEGTSAPNYRLSQGTQSRVAKAGLGGEARERLNKANTASGIIDVVTDVKDQVVAKQNDTAAREETWDKGFDAMGGRGSWASGELFDQFQDIETGYRDEYLEAVRTGDKKSQQRLLKDQGIRSSGLKGWKETMETAKEINDGVGWSKAFKSDEEAKYIVEALTTLDGKNATARFSENGEMVFDIKMKDGGTKSVTRREVEDMISEGVKPLKQEFEFMNSISKYGEDGSTGKPFNYNQVKRNNEINIKPGMIPALMKEDFGGGGTFEQHIKEHPEMKAAIVSRYADVNGDGEISQEEKAEMERKINEDIDLVIAEMGKKENEDTTISYLAEWQTLQQETAYEAGRDGYMVTKEAKRRSSLTGAERVAEDVARRKALINEKK
jgi:hypothetical protein